MVWHTTRRPTSQNVAPLQHVHFLSPTVHFQYVIRIILEITFKAAYLSILSSYSLYRMGHEKVARLPFCTCPCDILSLALVCILRRVFEQLVNSRTVNNPPPRLVVLDRMSFACIMFCIYVMLRNRATFSWSILYKKAYRFGNGVYFLLQVDML